MKKPSSSPKPAPAQPNISTTTHTLATMQFITVALTLIALASASPIATNVEKPSELEARQLNSVRNDLISGNAAACPSVILIFARASGEVGNMVCLALLYPTPSPSP